MPPRTAAARLGRRSFLAAGAAALAAAPAGAAAQTGAAATPLRPVRFGVSTYSFWQFRKEPSPIEDCIDRAARMGFDGVEILQVQMGDDQSNGRLQRLKRQAHALGLALMGFSTHQGFVNPDKAVRDDNVAKTLNSIDAAYRLGIPTMRINTGRWGTSKDFDALMANKGIEPNLPGHTDEEAFGWVIGSIERLLPRAEECGVVLGLENHWGLGRTAAGVMRIVEAIDSPWLRVTLDTGNFLDDAQAQMERLAPACCLVQAKTYDGGGKWYTLDIDYPWVAAMLARHGYQGWVSLEFEGKADPEEAVPESLARLEAAFAA
ncbi:MAG: sugar phosphate isomerase/epimerase family protein [Planctomycetaceae bacterium]